MPNCQYCQRTWSWKQTIKHSFEVSILQAKTIFDNENEKEK